jgi:hypothetical protein
VKMFNNIRQGHGNVLSAFLIQQTPPGKLHESYSLDGWKAQAFTTSASRLALWHEPGISEVGQYFPPGPVFKKGLSGGGPGP